MSKKRLIIDIAANFGSKFQERFAVDSLEQLIGVWRNFIDKAHRKNVVSVKIIDKEIEVEG